MSDKFQISGRQVERCKSSSPLVSAFHRLFPPRNSICRQSTSSNGVLEPEIVFFIEACESPRSSPRLQRTANGAPFSSPMLFSVSLTRPVFHHVHVQSLRASQRVLRKLNKYSLCLVRTFTSSPSAAPIRTIRRSLPEKHVPRISCQSAFMFILWLIFSDVNATFQFRYSQILDPS